MMSENGAAEGGAVLVIFYMWGQRCETVCESEEEALRWLSVCAGKGWLWAVEIVDSNGVVLHEDSKLREIVDS